ncbi:IclR family transcriptional regulator [Nonomuraea polychroma]|uniref:IclR family transcriptional regulator n=1 Tax=Nonomuraea polychroma TaxID=46176 RepID=A0A438LYT8_9ACTN|nr:IclR family transcriptional regulator [Nonomuraea polychroma]RVX38517.1 IclR family transcriptional regulator [Nonomuraea polychroma]
MNDLQHAGDEDRSPAASRQGIQSVEIAMTVLLALEQSAGPASLTQIAALSGMQPSKAHRYLVSLGRAGLVSQSPSSGLYDLGPAMRRLGAEALRRMDEVALASEYLPGLRDRTKHAINLAVWGDHGPVIVRWDYGSHVLPITVRVGATLPMLSSSIGRVYLTHLPRTLTDPVIAAQDATADQRFTDEEIERIKADVRHNGFAVTSGGVIPGVTSVAAPVFTTGEALPLAVAIVLPARLATDDVLRAVSAELLNTTGAMSAQLGHQGAATPEDRPSTSKPARPPRNRR